MISLLLKEISRRIPHLRKAFVKCIDPEKEVYVNIESLEGSLVCHGLKVFILLDEFHFVYFFAREIGSIIVDEVAKLLDTQQGPYRQEHQ